MYRRVTMALVALDDGHGSNTPGKRTPEFPDGTFMKENEFNSAVVNELKSILEFNGFDVLLVAPEKEDTPLQVRTDRANKAEADIYVSVHANAMKGSWGDWNGIETYHFPTSSKGKRLAKCVHEQLMMGTPFTDRGVKPANFHVLRETVMPAVLVECGFMDNLREATLLRSDKYRQECAMEIARGICNYFGKKFIEKHEDMTPLLGAMKASVEQMKAWAKNKGATEKFISVAELYYEYGKKTGLRGDILYCQSAKETAFGRYTGAVKPEMNNFAGIKIKNPTGDKTYDHESFPTVEDGVRAHFNHISAYVGIDPIGKPHDRYYLVKTIPWAGTIRYVEQLGGRYAPNPDYGKSIVRDYLTKLLTTEEVDKPVDWRGKLNDLLTDLERLVNKYKEV